MQMFYCVENINFLNYLLVKLNIQCCLMKLSYSIIEGDRLLIPKYVKYYLNKVQGTSVEIYNFHIETLTQ